MRLGALAICQQSAYLKGNLARSAYRRLFTIDGRCFVAQRTLYEPGLVIRVMERNASFLLTG